MKANDGTLLSIQLMLSVVDKGEDADGSETSELVEGLVEKWVVNT